MNEKGKILFTAKTDKMSVARNWFYVIIFGFLLLGLLVIYYAGFQIDSLGHTFAHNWIFFVALFFLVSTVALFQLTRRSIIELSRQQLVFKNRKVHTVSLDEVRYFCFFEEPEQSDMKLTLKVFLKSGKSRSLDLSDGNLNDIYILLSALHQLGFPVLLFGEMKNIEETKYYRPLLDLD